MNKVSSIFQVIADLIEKDAERCYRSYATLSKAPEFFELFTKCTDEELEVIVHYIEHYCYAAHIMWGGVTKKTRTANIATKLALAEYYNRRQETIEREKEEIRRRRMYEHFKEKEIGDS